MSFSSPYGPIARTVIAILGVVFAIAAFLAFSDRDWFAGVTMAALSFAALAGAYLGRQPGWFRG